MERSRGIKQHIFMHTGEKPFPCTQCKFRCNNKNNLKLHVKNRHSGNWINLILNSDKIFDLHFLMKLILQNQPIRIGKDWACPFCNRVMETKQRVARHIRTHTGEKPFACDLCDFTCSQKCNLLTHMKVHSEEKPFTCTYCPEAFKRKDNLQTHVRNRHL